MDKRMNVLPTPTWNRLSVNAAGTAFDLPELSGSTEETGKTEKAGASAAANLVSVNTVFSCSPLPKGIAAAELVSDPCTISEEFRLGDAVPDVSLGYAPTSFESGIGAYFDAYVREHAAAVCCLKSDGGSSETVHTEIVISNAKAGVSVSDVSGSDTSVSDAFMPAAPSAYHFQLTAEKEEELNLLQNIRSEAQAAGDVSTLTEIFAKSGSSVHLYQVETASEKSKVRQGVIVHMEKGAKVEVVRAVMGGDASACGTRAYLTGTGSRFVLKTVYFASGAQKFDFNDIADHRGRTTVSDMYTAGVLAGKSEKTLRGTIDFKKGASHAVGHEAEDVLLLANGVKNRTVPLILCGEEDVEGQHAASSGKPDERQIYYLCSRGLTPANAAKLLVEGRFAPVLDRLPETDMRELLSADVERRLNAYEASSEN